MGDIQADCPTGKENPSVRSDEQDQDPLRGGDETSSVASADADPQSGTRLAAGPAMAIQRRRVGDRTSRTKYGARVG